MSLKLVCGRAGSGKSEYCFEEIAQILKKERNKIYIITPEQFSFTAEKNLLKKINERAVIQAEVLTFQRMAYRLLTEVGGATKTFLSEAGKSMLLNHIVMQHRKELKLLGKSEQNREMINRQFTEFKKHGITVEKLKQVKEEIEEEAIRWKIQDMITLYEPFEASFQNEYRNQEDSLSMLKQALGQTNLFDNSYFYLDEFVGFTKQEYDVIEVLMRKAKRMTITICTDNLDTMLNRDTDVFYTNKQTAEKLLYIAKKQEIALEKTTFLETSYRFKKEDLKHLEKNLYQTTYECKKQQENIHLFLAKNPYSEIEEVAKQIIELVREEKYRYREIAIITKNMENYASLCKAIFKQYEIPYFIDEKKDLSQNNFVKYLCSILEIFSKNWSYEAVFDYIKTGFLQIPKEDIFRFEKFCQKWGVKGKKWYQGEWDFVEETEKNKQELERIREIRKQIVNPLQQLKEKLGGIKTVQQITKEIYQFFIERDIPEILQEKKKEQEEKGNYTIAQEYDTIWEVIIHLLDELVLVLGEQKTTFEKYSETLKVGLKESGLGKIPMSQDQITIGDVDRTRSHKVKVIFIVGLNDGVFPNVNKNEGFFNDGDRAQLKQKGIELAKGTLEQLYDDNFNIYKAFTTAEEKLYLSYPSGNLDGSPLRPSMLITKIKKIYPSLKEKSDMIQKEYNLYNKTITFQELVENIRRKKEGEEIESIWYEVYHYFKKQPDWNVKLKTTIKALVANNLPEKITKENIDKLYGNTLYTSISKLEQYKACAFSYFLKYGLKLSEKEDFKVQALDTGNFMHETIDSFFERIKEEGISIKALEEETIKQFLEEIVQEKLQLAQNYIFRSSAKYELLVVRLLRILTLCMKYIIEGLKNSDFTVFGNELEFKKGKTYAPIVLELEKGKKVEITGKIDRVDIAKIEEEIQDTYIRIIDYKSSIKDFDFNQVYEGLQLQLLTYLDATCEITEMLPAGVLYLGLIEPMIKAEGRLTKEEIEEKIKENFRMRGLILADVKLIKKMDKTLETGKSSIIPVTLDKEGNINTQRSSTVTQQEFSVLQQYTKKLIKQIAREIISGSILPEPYYDVRKKKTPCEYCSYAAICQIKEDSAHNHYHYIGNLSREEILKKMEKEEEPKWK